MSSLWDYSNKRVVLREPAESDDSVVCPECGRNLDFNKESGSEAHVPIGTLVDADLAASLQDVDQLPTHGWVCERHPNYAVVCPDHTGRLCNGWTGVLVEFADGHAREVPVPEQEVR